MLCATVFGTSARAAADARTEYLVKLLGGSNQFRVRVQAAISLGSVDDSAPIQVALTRALEDEHPAVRAAAASTLGRLGNPGAIAALRGVEDDSEAPVRVAAKAALARLNVAARRAGAAAAPAGPRGPPRFYVSVGRPASAVKGLEGDVLGSAQRFLTERIGQIEGVVLAPDGESPGAASKVLTRRRLKGYYIESSVTSLEKKPDGGTRVAVSVIVATYPGRDMRAIVKGAATVMGMGPSTVEQAVQGALTGALRQIPQALGH